MRDPDAHERLAAVLTTMLVRRFRESIYAAVGDDLPVPIRDGTYPVLMALSRAPATAAAISTAVGIDRTVASRQAADLVAAGLVAARPDPGDRRGNQLALTDAGERVAATVQQRFLDLIAATTADWSDRELNGFVRQLQRFAEGLTATAPR